MRKSPVCLPLLVLILAFGCGSTAGTSSGGGSTQAGTYTLQIDSPTDGTCVEVPLDRAAGVPIRFTTTGIDRRAPGDCGVTTFCGHVVLSVGGVPNNSGANLVIDALSTPETPLSGPIDVTLKLVADGGTDLLGSDGKPITASVSLVAQVSCGGGTGGTGGTTTTGTGGTGGTTTGTGGSGGTTTGTGGSGGSTTTGTGGSGGTTTTGTGGSGGTTTGTGGSGGTGGSTTTGT